MSVNLSTTQAVTPPPPIPRPAVSRSNIFICFASAERDFARDLDDALRKRRRISAIDWSDDDATLNLSPKTFQRIEAADTFIFIISPSSVASDVCRRQLEHAVKMNKAIVPLVRLRVEEKAWPAPLASLPVIDYRAEVDFLKAFEAVIKAANTNLRIDVFLCYSRADKVFVNRLYEALIAAGRRVWLDLSSIPTSTVWQQEIFSGIEAADNFIFIISPDSLRPDSFCHKEFAHAQGNKRIIPLYHREADPAIIPPTLAQYQRRDFPAGGDFEADFQRLLDDLDQDPDYLREHTRLLTRALEWQRGGSEESLLLRGSDLTHAETLIRTAADKQPHFTNLQTQYVLASREAASRTRNKLLGGVITALVLTALLSVGLFFQTRSAQSARQTAVEQRNDATKQRDIAEQRRLEADAASAEARRQQAIAETQKGIAQTKEQEALAAAKAERLARDQAEQRRLEAVLQRQRAQRETLISQSRELVLGGESKIKQDSQLSLLLAIEAARRGTLAEGKIDERTASLLQRAALTSIPRVMSDTEGLESIAWEPSGEWVASGSSDGKVVIISAKDARVVDRFDAGGWADCIAWTSDGALLAVGTRENGVVLWDAVRKKAFAPLRFEDQIVSVSWRKDSRHLAIALARGDGSIVRVLDWESQRVLFEVPGIRGAWSPNGELLATGGGNGVVRLYSKSGKFLAEMPGHDRYVSDIAWTSDSERFATASVDNKIMIWDALAYKRLKILPAQFALGVTWSPDSSRLACGSGESVVTVWDGRSYELLKEFKSSNTITGDVISESGAQGYVVDIDWSPDGSVLAASERGASFGDKGSVLLLPSSAFSAVKPGDWLALAKTIVKRPFTKNECVEYLHKQNCQP